MPIYEFYCPACHMLLNFFARGVKPDARPDCPHCGRKRLERQVSAFAVTGRAKGGDPDGAGGGGDDFPVDDARMEQAMESLAGEAESLDENDPRQAARLMRKFSQMTGMDFNENIESALKRMESGEDPDKIEEKMGDLGEDENPFVMPGGKPRGKGARRAGAPLRRDPKLYDL